MAINTGYIMNALHICVITFLFLVQLPAQAALHDRGEDFVYDDVLNITWHRDALLSWRERFGVTGPEGPGSMSWDEAHQWIAELNRNGYKGYHTWRLPRITHPDASCSIQDSSSGTQTSYGIQCSGSELGSLYYTSMGQSYFDTSCLGLECDPQACTFNSPEFYNLSCDTYSAYWYGNETNATAGKAWMFNLWGGQGQVTKDQYNNVWPVLDGDIAGYSRAARAVPSLSAVAVILLGLLLSLACVRFCNTHLTPSR